MAKLTLSDVSNLLGNPTTAATTINANSDLIEAALENTLSRDGTTPNQMAADLDMNNNHILNIGSLEVQTLKINDQEVGTTDIPLVILDEVRDLRDQTEDIYGDTLGLVGGVTLEVTVVPLTFDGVQTVFPLGVDPGFEGNVLVEVNGVTQTTSEYSISSTNLIFTAAPPVGTGEARILAHPATFNALSPGSFTSYPTPWLLSSSVDNDGRVLGISQTTVATSGNIEPLQSIETTYVADSAIGLDFVGAPGGSVPVGLYVQHRQTGSNPANNAFTHSIMAYAVNDAAGDNDVIAVSGRVRKNPSTTPALSRDAAGVWGSAYQHDTGNGLTMAGEYTIYQNVAGNIPDDRLNSGSHAASVALHLGSYSTGSPATAIIAADGSGEGVWNYEIVDRNLFKGAGTAGTVGYNCSSWNASQHPEIGWKIGLATWHIYRGDAAIDINANQVNLQNTRTNGAAGHRIKSDGSGNSYIDFMTGTTFRGQAFWDGVNQIFTLGSVGAHPMVLRTNETERLRLTDDGNIILQILSKDYANDVDAALGGIPVGGLYHNNGIIRIRLS